MCIFFILYCCVFFLFFCVCSGVIKNYKTVNFTLADGCSTEFSGLPPRCRRTLTEEPEGPAMHYMGRGARCLARDIHGRPGGHVIDGLFRRKTATSVRCWRERRFPPLIRSCACISYSAIEISAASAVAAVVAEPASTRRPLMPSYQRT